MRVRGGGVRERRFFITARVSSRLVSSSPGFSRALFFFVGSGNPRNAIESKRPRACVSVGLRDLGDWVSSPEKPRVANISMRYRPRVTENTPRARGVFSGTQRAFARAFFFFGARGREQSRGGTKTKRGRERPKRDDHMKPFRVRVSHLCCVRLARPPCSPRARPRLGPDPGLRLVRLLVRVLLVVPSAACARGLGLSCPRKNLHAATRIFALGARTPPPPNSPSARPPRPACGTGR